MLASRIFIHSRGVFTRSGRLKALWIGAKWRWGFLYLYIAIGLGLDYVYE
jgi:hypothetical protein